MDTTDTMSGKQKRKGEHNHHFFFYWLTVLFTERNKAVRNLPVLNVKENSLGKIYMEEEDLLYINLFSFTCFS